MLPRHQSGAVRNEFFSGLIHRNSNRFRWYCVHRHTSEQTIESCVHDTECDVEWSGWQHLCSAQHSSFRQDKHRWELHHGDCVALGVCLSSDRFEQENGCSSQRQDARVSEECLAAQHTVHVLR
eukprot:PhF_6_TR883/c0_g1_i1/m.1345